MTEREFSRLLHAAWPKWVYCRKCGWLWEPRLGRTPVECPDCKLRKWWAPRRVRVDSPLGFVKPPRQRSAAATAELTRRFGDLVAEFAQTTAVVENKYSAPKPLFSGKRC